MAIIVYSATLSSLQLLPETVGAHKWAGVHFLPFLAHRGIPIKTEDSTSFSQLRVPLLNSPIREGK